MPDTLYLASEHVEETFGPVGQKLRTSVYSPARARLGEGRQAEQRVPGRGVHGAVADPRGGLQEEPAGREGHGRSELQ